MFQDLALAAIDLNDPDSRGHLEVAVLERDRLVQLAFGCPRKLLSEPKQGNCADRHEEEPDEGQFGTHRPRSDQQPGDLRDVLHEQTELRRDHAQALGVVVGAHHEIAPAAPVEEADGQREELLEYPPHPLELHAAGQMRRQHLGGIGTNRAQQPHPEHRQGAH